MDSSVNTAAAGAAVGAALPLAPAEGLESRTLRIIEKASSSTLSTSEIRHILEQAALGQQGLGAHISAAQPSQPPAGQLFIIDRQAAPHYLSDGHTWRRKERHMLLKVNGTARVNCYYAVPQHDTGEQAGFQRRRYWLLGNKDLVLVHYLVQQKPRGHRAQANRPVVRPRELEAEVEEGPGQGKRARCKEEEGQAQPESPLASAQSSSWDLDVFDFGPLGLSWEPECLGLGCLDFGLSGSSDLLPALGHPDSWAGHFDFPL